LALIGLPDGRRRALRARSSAALMTAKQFNNSRSLAGAGAEIILVTHGSEPGAAGIGAQLQLSSAAVAGRNAAVDVLIEDMFDSWERLLAMQRFLDRLAREVSRFWPLRYDRSRTKDQVFAPTTAAPVSAAAIYQLLSRTAERYEHTSDQPLPFQMVQSDWRGSAPARKTTVWRDSASGDDT
jgi:hypothetical protein